jgi:DNA processing protein
MSERQRHRGSSYPDGAAGAVRIERGDARYPAELEDLQENAPSHFWTRGSLDLFDVRPRVAIVGTRRATPYGQRITRELVAALVRAGACIVSGLARGIDAAAHRAALELGGATIAVLGTGLNAAFPLAHRELQREVAARGLLITELDHDEHGMKFTFPRRNRLIAALSEATVVVEAPARSGALNTADHALQLGRTVAAVPGPIDQPQSVGANQLILSGAVILTSIEDALALVGLTPPPRTPSPVPGGDEGRVRSALSDGPLDIDTLCHRSGLPAGACMTAVTRLEIAGSIECALSGEIRRR